MAAAAVLGLLAESSTSPFSPPAAAPPDAEPQDVGLARAAGTRHSALVDEALQNLHGTTRSTLTAAWRGGTTPRHRCAVGLAGPRLPPEHGGVRRVREAVAAQLDAFTEQVASRLGPGRRAG